MARSEKTHKPRPWTFYPLAVFFGLFVLFLYGPMFCIYILSFQGPNASLVFPMQGLSLHWFEALFGQARTGDVGGAFARSLPLSLIILGITVLFSVAAGLAFRSRFFGNSVIFYTAIGSLVVPGLVLGVGITLLLQLLGWNAHWYSSALGAHLTWTLPFGLLIMFAVLSRFDPRVEEAARDLGASNLQSLRYVMIPILLPGIIAVALFGFTLSYDEFPRSTFTVGARNTLPLEIWSMTTNITSPALYALGTVTTAISFFIILISLTAIGLIQSRRQRSQRQGPGG